MITPLHFRPIWLILCLAAGGSQAQVVINEVMADNRGAVENGPDYPDYIELHNPSALPVGLAGMSLTDDAAQPRRFVFPMGISIPAGGHLVVWCDSSTSSPGLHTGFGLGAGGDRAQLYAADGVTLVDEVFFGLQVPDLSIGRVPDAYGAWTLNRPSAGAANVPQPLAPPVQLRLNEWMARPSTGHDWLEVFNGDGVPVALGGLVITDLAAGSPTNRPIPALSFVQPRGFVQFFASDLNKLDANHLDFKLGSGGETLTIYHPDRTTQIDRVSFGSQSTDISQGRAPDGSSNLVFFPLGRATPGSRNYSPLTNVVISEVLSHTDPPLEDAIELHNPTSLPVDISHWWLSDTAGQPQKYRIPTNTIIPALGFKVFYQYQLEAGPSGFTLNSSEGDEVFLSVGDTNGTLNGQQTYVEFGGLKNGVSVGRHATSVGIDFVPLSQRTFGVDNPSSLPHFRSGGGLPNATPRVGPVVITEIMHYPPDVGGQSNTDDEFIELHNPHPYAVPLYDPIYPTNTWRLRDGIELDLPRYFTLAAGGCVLLVCFDPAGNPAKLASFRARYALPAAVPVLGPYIGKLSDAGEELELLLPDAPQGPDKPNPGYVPYMLVERVSYSRSAPWPSGSAGTGYSLQRRVPLAYGNEPLNWLAAVPTPGSISPPDTDADGMPDAWESAYGLDPNSAADAASDPDDDALENLAEYLAGTNPTNSASVLRVAKLQRLPAGIQLSFHAVEGRSYSVLGSATVLEHGWLNLSNILTVASSGELEILLPTSSEACRFYRLVTPAAP